MGMILLIFLLAGFILAPHIMVTMIKNLPMVIIYGIKDIYSYFKYKKWRLYKAGVIRAYNGIFGSGKNLSGVHDARAIYRAYNGLRVFCPRRRKWVTQKVSIISNFEFKDIPYEHLESLQQIVDYSNNAKKIDDEFDTLTIRIFCIDELGSEMNSREFKHNVDAYTLNSIVTCRHSNISIFWMAQRFHMVDKLMRDVTSDVYNCKKIWRFEFLRLYDGWMLENASSPDMVPCTRIDSFFVTDDDYNAYDTYATVDKLKKNAVEGKNMTEEEILALRGYGSESYSEELIAAYKKGQKKRYLF